MSLEDDILIDNYLRGLLKYTEVQDFKLRLELDAEFKKVFILEKVLWESQNETDWNFVDPNNKEIEAYKKLLEKDDLQNLKKTLNRVNLEFTQLPNRKTKYNFYYIAAASIAILICLSIFLKQDVSNQKLVNDYLNASSLPSYVSRGESLTNDLIEAQQLFENEEYKKSLDIFIPALESNSDDASVYLYIGIAQIKLEKYSDAEGAFDKLIQTDLLDAQKGHWYKALLYLKQDKVKESKIVLEKIIANSYYNHSKAKELLEKLNDD